MRDQKHEDHIKTHSQGKLGANHAFLNRPTKAADPSNNPRKRMLVGIQDLIYCS